MIDLFDLYQKLVGKVNTHQGGHVKPNGNFVNWVNTIQLEIFEDAYKDWEKDQSVSDRLSPFLVSKNVVVKKVPGQMWDVITLPEDYEHFASARVRQQGGKFYGCSTCETIDGTTGKKASCEFLMDEDELQAYLEKEDSRMLEQPVDKVNNGRWASLIKHRTMSPNVTGIPKCTQFDGGLKVAPKGTGVLILDYFRLPRPGSFNFTIINPNTENEYIEYNSVGSNPLEFSQSVIPEFLTRLQKIYGTFTREPLLWEQGERDKVNQP